MGVILKAKNESLVKDQPFAHLTADAGAASGTLTVDNIAGFSVGKYAILGELGDSKSEIVRIHVSTAPSGTTITLNANTVYDHFLGTRITIIDYNQVEFSRSTSLTGSKSVLDTINITPDSFQTIYDDLTNTTGFWFWRFTNSATSAFGSYSTGVNYTGFGIKSVQKIADRARRKTTTSNLDKGATDEDIIDYINECTDIIRNSQDWAYELTSDDTSIASTENEYSYALSSLTNEIKYPDTKQALLNVRFGSDVIDYVDIDEMDKLYENTARTLSSGSTASGSTTLVVDDVSEFSDSGTLYAGADTVTYTGRNTSTNTFTGIPASGTGSITATLADDSVVIQGITPGTPTKYTVFNDNIILDKPVQTSKVGYKIKLRYLALLDQVSDVGDELTSPFTYIYHYYVAAQIEYSKGNKVEGDQFYTFFDRELKRNQRKYKIQVFDETDYYKFDSGASALSKAESHSNL